jgi:phosphatidylinositol alpha-1,6-mannosyltransferase
MAHGGEALANVMVLAVESFGGRGGIAAYTRDLVEAYEAEPRVGSVTVVSRLTPVEAADPPAHVRMIYPKQSRLQYAGAVAAEVVRRRPAVIHCTHVDLAPVAAMMSRLFAIPWWLTLHGAEVWQRHRSRLVNRAVAGASLYLSVSKVTANRFQAAFPECAATPTKLLPPSVDIERFRPGEPSRSLRSRLSLGDRRVILTMGRLNASERAKGFDRVITALPALQRDFPDLAYLIAGSGDDAPRLMQLARAHGVESSVVMAGYVSEEDKPDLFRIASAYVMPSTLEGFGIVFLEAMACGTPCVASVLDAGQEAIGDCGEAVDPFDAAALVAAIGRVVQRERRVPAFIANYSRQCFGNRVSQIVNDVLNPASASHGEYER